MVAPEVEVSTGTSGTAMATGAWGAVDDPQDARIPAQVTIKKRWGSFMKKNLYGDRR